jgi:Fic family protein
MKNFIAGKRITQNNYKSFQPENINRQWYFDDMELLNLLSRADRQIGRLDMYSEYIPNIDLFISMHVVKEATQSSKIEGTKTQIEEALLEKDNIADEKRDDWDEVQNYIEALYSAIGNLEKFPFSSRLIKETHGTLLQDVRGMNKMPGEFRNSQNWIGGASLSDAMFIPPHWETVNELMSDLEKFVHNEQIQIPELLKIAIIHYQFETIHPFLDGNGRIGRLLITLYLVNKGILKLPILYLSDFFEKNRTLYYDNLTRVREKNDITQWLKFFLVGVLETARNGIDTFDGILKLKKDVDEKLMTMGSRAANAQKLIEAMYTHPLVDANKVQSITGLSKPTVYKLLDDLVNAHILKEKDIVSKSKTYVFDDYLELFK